MNLKRGHPRSVRRLAVLAVAVGVLLTGAVSIGGAHPVLPGPADPTTAANLAPLWTSQFGNGKYRASPVVAGDFIYVGDSNGYLTKLPLATGTAGESPVFSPTWTTNVCFNGIMSKPAVGGGRVFVSTIAGSVCAFDEATGALIWRRIIPSFGWASGPLLVDNLVYVTGHNGDVVAYDAFSATGTQCWATNVGGSDTQNPMYGGPIMLGDQVYVGTFDGRIMAVTPPVNCGAATVTELARFTGGRISDVLATDGVSLYAAVNYPTSPSVGTVRVVSLTPQGQIRWNVDTGLDPTYDLKIQAPAVVDGVVYAPTKTKLVYLRSDTGARIALADTSPNQPTTPAVVNGVAYVGGIQVSGAASGALQAFDARTGIPLYYAHTRTVANTVPAVAPDGTVLLGGGNSGQGAGVIWAFAPTNPPHNQ